MSIVTIRVTLVQRYFDSTPNAAHFSCAYDAWGADLTWTPTHAVLHPARDGRNFEEIPYREFISWVESQEP